MSFYIKQLDSGLWGEIIYNEDFSSKSKSDLANEGWYSYENANPPFIDIDTIATKTYTLSDHTVTPIWNLVRKTGAELEEAINIKWIQVRLYRNQLLSKSDYTQLPDVSLTDDEKSRWSSYRQQLRDITKTTNDPFTISWPVDPNGNTGEFIYSDVTYQ